MHSTLSEVIGDSVRRRREHLGMTREQLADRCAELGYPELTYAALTNIERTGTSKTKRRREVTVDELMILGYALAMPPLLLAFPVGEVDAVPIPPRSNPAHPHLAYRWAVGLEPPGVVGPNGRMHAAGGPVGGSNNYRDMQQAWNAAGSALFEYETLHSRSGDVGSAMRWHGEPEQEEAFRKLADQLNRMLRAGLSVPAYTPAWAARLRPLLDQEELLPVLLPDGTVKLGGYE